jgi:hypothetical protein
MGGSSIIEKSGQLWKVRLSWYCGLAGLGIMFVGWLIFAFPLLLLVGVILLLGSLVFASVSIRCPVCRASWLWDWNARTRRERLGPIGHLMTLSECPRCGNQSGSKEEARHAGDST